MLVEALSTAATFKKLWARRWFCRFHKQIRNRNFLNVSVVILQAVNPPASQFINKTRMRDKQLFADSVIPTRAVSPF